MIKKLGVWMKIFLSLFTLFVLLNASDLKTKENSWCFRGNLDAWGAKLGPQNDARDYNGYYKLDLSSNKRLYPHHRHRDRGTCSHPMHKINTQD